MTTLALALLIGVQTPNEVPFRIADDAIVVDATVNGKKASFMFDTPYALPPGETLRLRYALLIADGPFDAERFRDELPA